MYVTKTCSDRRWLRILHMTYIYEMSMWRYL